MKLLLKEKLYTTNIKSKFGNTMKQIFPLLNTITGVWELIEQESQYHTQEQGQETMNPTERIPCHTLVKPS